MFSIFSLIIALGLAIVAVELYHAPLMADDEMTVLESPRKRHRHNSPMTDNYNMQSNS
ncbi:hypothetical protein ACQRCU_01645 [Streptococcus alactolyticus]|nr:hypothetical protein [Streptococcus sp. UBA3373]MDD7361960.1 hypothetical protein [Streptococcus alactolyticus]